MSESAASPLRIVLPRPPAPGQGTRGRRPTAGDPGTDTLVREKVAPGTTLGKPARPILVRAAYPPDGLMCRILNLNQPSHCDATVPRNMAAENLLGHLIPRPDTRPV